jgi:hypothetical protein
MYYSRAQLCNIMLRDSSLCHLSSCVSTLQHLPLLLKGEHLTFRGNPTTLCFLNSLNADLNPIRHLLALLGAHHILHVSRIRVTLKYHDLYTYVHYQLLGICTKLTL